jgi:hypothetical protein
MHCIILISAHICAYAIDHTEPELEEPSEQVQAEEGNTDLKQGKPRCI